MTFEYEIEWEVDGQLLDDVMACAQERGISVNELITNAVRDDLAR